MLNFIAYTDGGCKPNPGYGGFGVFGYTYTLEGSKYNKHPVHGCFFTEEGFSVEKKDSKITVESIYEHIEYISGKTTNNTAELYGVIRALQYACNLEKLSSVCIYTDSNYIVSSIENLDKWKVNGWKRQDGQIITHREEWLTIVELLTFLNSSSTLVNIKWIKGHNGSYGNEVADLFAAIAVNASFQYKDQERSKVIYSCVSPLKDYRKSYVEKDFVLTFRDMFYTSRLSNTSYYFLSNIEKENINIGKKSTESIFAINVGFVPKYIESIKSFIDLELDPFSFYCIKLSRLGNKDKLRLFSRIDIRHFLYREGNSYYICKDEAAFITKSNPTLPLLLNVSKTFTHMVNAYEHVNELSNCTIDITPIFLQDGKLTIMNSDEYVDFSVLLPMIREGAILGDAEKVELEKFLTSIKSKLIVRLGHDLPSYLSLKSIEEQLESISIVFEPNIDTRALTCYFRIKCLNREIFTCNITNKFLL